MKRAVFMFALLAFICTGFASFAQETSPQLLYVLTHTIKPGKVAVHDEAVNGLVETFKKHNFNYPSWSYMSENLAFYAIMPMNTMGDVDAMFEDMGRVGNEAGDAWARAGELEAESLESYSGSVYMPRPDLSWHPASGRLANGEGTFQRWTFYSVKVGSEAVVEGLLSDLAAMYKKHGIRDGFSVYMAIMDRDMPVYNVVQYGRDRDDFYSHHTGNMKTLGQESRRLFDTLRTHLRKTETEHVTYQPQFSMPGN